MLLRRLLARAATESRHVLIGQPLLHLLDRHDVAIAHDEIDIVEGDAFRFEAIVDHLLVETGGVFLARDAFLGDGIGDDAVAQQARADVVVIDVQTEHVGVLFRHGTFWEGILCASSLRSCRVQGLRCIFLFGHVPHRTSRSVRHRFCNVDERTANLTLLRRLNKVPIERKNLSENIVLAHVNRAASRAY